MALLLILIASLVAAVVNLLTKKNLERVGSPQGYLVVYFFFSLVSALIIYPRTFQAAFSWSMFSVGMLAGLLNFFMMIFLTRALKFGPPGLSFAFQNAGAVLPAVLLFLVFGKAYGFLMTPFLIIGLTCVVFGLFWSAYPQGFRQTDEGQFSSFKKWIALAFATFACQGFSLAIFQYRCLLLNSDLPSHSLIFSNCNPKADLWFMPGLFISATVLNAAYFIYLDRRRFCLPEILYGAGAGLLNGVTTFCLLLSALFAKEVERGVIFPLFAILVIFFCSIWGKSLYHEKVHWRAIFLCMMGVLIASL